MSRSQDSSNSIPISVACKNCLKEYDALYDQLAAATPEQALEIGFDRNASQDFVQDARSRFKAWAVGIAALQGAHFQSSLDFRLKEAGEIRQRIVKILTTLQGSLRQALLIANGTESNERWEVGAISDSDDEIGSKEEGAAQTSELEQLFAAIKTANSSLMKFSMVIRNSPSRDDYLKAASRYNFDTRFDIGHVTEKHGAAKGSSDWLVERLGKAITRRRQYLKYRKEHHTKLTRDWEQEVPEEVVAPAFDEVPLPTVIEQEKPERTIALTKATTYVENKALIEEKDGVELDQGSFGSQTSYEPTVIAEAVNKLNVPPPPTMAFEGVPFEFGEPFQCPYCYMEQTVKSKTAWKKHVFRDLKPYVCTFKECNLRMFRSRNEWFAHELQNHRREWICISCLKSFTDRVHFSDHLQSAHSSLIAESQLEALVLQCEEPVDKIPASGCLLCDEWESNLLDPKQDLKRLFLNNGEIVEPCGTLGQFRRHLGRHMEQLALFALPMTEEDEMEDDSLDGSSNDSEDVLKEKGDAFDSNNDNITSDVEPLPHDLWEKILGFVAYDRFDCDMNELAQLVFEHFRGEYALSEEVFTLAMVRSYLSEHFTRFSEDGPWIIEPNVIHGPFPDIVPEDEVVSSEDRLSDSSILDTPYSEEFYYGIIDRAVPEGPEFLRQAFQQFPGISGHVPYIRTKIDEIGPKQLAQVADFSILIVEMVQHDEQTRKGDREKYYHNLVDVAIGRGSAALRELLENYPLLLANSDYYSYLQRMINTSLLELEQAQVHDFIKRVLNLTLIIRRIPYGHKQDQFLDLVAILGLHMPKSLNFQFVSAIPKGWALARFGTVREANQAMAALNGFELQGQKLRVETLTEYVANLRRDEAGSSAQTFKVDEPIETSSNEAAVSETDASKASFSHVVTLDWFSPDVMERVKVSGSPTLIAFLSPTEQSSKSFLPVYEEVAQAFAFAKDKLTIAKVDLPSVSQTGPMIEYAAGNGDALIRYDGDKDLKSLVQFLFEKTWRRLCPPAATRYDVSGIPPQIAAMLETALAPGLDEDIEKFKAAVASVGVNQATLADDAQKELESWKISSKKSGATESSGMADRDVPSNSIDSSSFSNSQGGGAPAAAAANNPLPGADELAEPSDDFVEAGIVHFLAIEPMNYMKLLACFGDLSSKLSHFSLILQKVASCVDSFPKEAKWILRQRYYLDLDVWDNIFYSSDVDRQRAIDNAIKEYDEMGLALNAPEWDRLLPQAERGTGKCLSKRHGKSTTTLQKTCKEIQEDEMAALSSKYRQDFRTLDTYRDGLNMFEIWIRSSNKDIAVNLRVELPHEYPKTAPLIQYAGSGKVPISLETQESVRDVIETMSKKFVAKEEPMIMEIVNACVGLVEDDARRAVVHIGKQAGLPNVFQDRRITVFVHDGLDTVTSIQCSTSDGLDVFRQLVAKAIGRPTHQVVLRHGSESLQDEFTLGMYGVQDGAQIDLLPYRNTLGTEQMAASVSRRRASDDDDVYDDSSAPTATKRVSSKVIAQSSPPPAEEQSRHRESSLDYRGGRVPTAFKDQHTAYLSILNSSYDLCQIIRGPRPTPNFDGFQTFLITSKQNLNYTFAMLRASAGSRYDLGDTISRTELDRAIRSLQVIQSKLASIAYSHERDGGWESLLYQVQTLEAEVLSTFSGLKYRLDLASKGDKPKKSSAGDKSQPPMRKTNWAWDAYETLGISSRNDSIILCTGITGAGKRCRWALSEAARKEIHWRVLELEAMPPGASAIRQSLPKIATLCLCEEFHQGQAPETVKKWEAMIEKAIDDRKGVFSSGKEDAERFTGDDTASGSKEGSSLYMPPSQSSTIFARGLSQQVASSSESTQKPVTVRKKRLPSTITNQTFRSESAGSMAIWEIELEEERRRQEDREADRLWKERKEQEREERDPWRRMDGW